MKELSDRLQGQYGIADRIRFSHSPEKRWCAHLSLGGSTCTISLYGGHVLDAILSTGEQLFWLSPRAVYQDGKAIRGGVPIVFPWFGNHPEDESKPAHGFARLSLWKVKSSASSERETKLTLILHDDEHTRRFWRHSFAASLVVSLSEKGLSQSLSITNTGDQTWTWAGGFHPYFAVDSISRTQLKGLEGQAFVDLTNGELCVPKRLTFGTEVDRAYQTDRTRFEILSETHESSLILECSGTDSVVVWNPGLGNEKSDMPEHGAQRFLCLEPARSAHLKNWSQRSALKAGECTEISYKLLV